MAVNSTQTRTRSNARAGRSPKTPATPAASTRRTRPGRVSPAPLHPVPIAGSRPKPSASAAEVVQAYLKVQVATLRSLEPKVRADEFDSVHQMRVATRRLRATLRSFGKVIPRPATEKVAGELTWLGGLLGEARDVLPAAVHKAYRQTSRRMRRARQAPRGQARDVALHEARKSARRARYAAEVARPASGKPARMFVRQMKKVQSVVGDHQDTVIARQAARELGIGAHLAGENAFTYGLLHEREHDQAERLQARARTVWKKASRPRRRGAATGSWPSSFATTPWWTRPRPGRKESHALLTAPGSMLTKLMRPRGAAPAGHDDAMPLLTLTRCHAAFMLLEHKCR